MPHTNCSYCGYVVYLVLFILSPACTVIGSLSVTPPSVFKWGFLCSCSSLKPSWTEDFSYFHNVSVSKPCSRSDYIFASLPVRPASQTAGILYIQSLACNVAVFSPSSFQTIWVCLANQSERHGALLWP